MQHKEDNMVVTLVTITFSRKNFEKLSQNEVWKLSSTAADLFHLINEFAELNRIKMRSYYNLLMTNYKTKHQTLVGYFNFTSTETFSTHSKKVK